MIAARKNIFRVYKKIHERKFNVNFYNNNNIRNATLST